MITKLFRKSPTEASRAEEDGENQWATSCQDDTSADPPLLASSVVSVESCGRREITLGRDIAVHNFPSLSWTLPPHRVRTGKGQKNCTSLLATVCLYTVLILHSQVRCVWRGEKLYITSAYRVFANSPNITLGGT